MPNKKKKLALYKQIEMELMEKINSGYYKIGSAIPTEHELSNIYNVSRITVRQATNNLVAQGLLVRNQGSGTFVSNRTPIYERKSRIMGFKEEMEQAGEKPSTEVLTFEIRPADSGIADNLKIKAQSPIYYIIRIRKANGQPLVLEISYISVEKYPDITYEIMTNSKYDYFEKMKNLEIDYSLHKVLPIMPNPFMVDVLKIDADKPILKVLNTTFLKNGDVLDYTELIFNSERYQYIATKSR